MTDKINVGRGRPPLDRQFGRGQKRAAGRPKGALGEKSIAQKIAGEVQHVLLSGKSVSVTTLELLLLTMRNLAMKGDLRAAKWLSEYRGKVLASEATGGFLVVPEVASTEQFVAEMLFRNRFSTNPELKGPFGLESN